MEPMEVVCPHCGAPMEFGHLYGKVPLLWSPKKKRILLKGKEDVSLFQGQFPEAWICKACRTVVARY